MPPPFDLCYTTNLVTLLYQNIVDFLECIFTWGRYAAEIRHPGKKSRGHLGTFYTAEEVARGYLLYDPPSTDRSSLMAAMENHLEFDIHDLDLTGLSFISELTNVLVSFGKRSLTAIKDFDHWFGMLPNLKNEKWATIKVYSSEGQRPLKVISLSTGWKLVSRLQLINVSWRGSPWSSAIPGGGEIVGLALSSSGFAATNNRANLVGQNPSGSTSSHSNKKRRRDGAVGKQINFAISEQDLRQHFGRTRAEAAKCLGVSVSTFKRRCRENGILRWPCNQIDSSVCKPPDPNESEASCPYDGAFHREDQIEVSSAYPNCNDLECAQPQVASKEMVTENTVSSDLASRVEAQLEGDGFGTEPTCFDTASSQLMSPIPETGPTIPEIMPPLIARQDRGPVTMKAIYRDSIIKFQLPLSTGLTELNKEVAMRLALEPGTFDVEYKDDDEDWITITCDKDLRDYLQLFSSSVNPVPKLLVLDKVVNANESGGSFKHSSGKDHRRLSSKNNSRCHRFHAQLS